MSQYTEILHLKAETLSMEDDGYEESLLEVATLFRSFDEAFTAFMVNHGYRGDVEDVSAKARFLRQKFESAHVKLPHSFKEWFVPNRKLSRKTVFQICFAFGLGVDETNDFFRCVQYERGFDCHTIREAVYYFCMRKGLSYLEAQALIDRIPVPRKVKVIPDHEVLYTGTIIEALNRIDDSDALIEYIEDHIDDFRYNNVTAIKYIRELWTEISGTNGLAVQEGRLIDKAYNRYKDKQKKGMSDTRPAEVIAEEINRQEKEVKPYDYVVAGSDASTWTIFSQIIGLANYQEMTYSTLYDRSLSSVLSENKLLPLKADYCFPSRQSIDKLVRGEFVGDDEMIRKLLIFLVFYTYWVKQLIRKNNVFFTAAFSDSERCLDTINARLLDAGYPELYVGNPYDWLFQWALNDENPLIAFRHYIGEVFAIKAETSED